MKEWELYSDQEMIKTSTLCLVYSFALFFLFYFQKKHTFGQKCL